MRPAPRAVLALAAAAGCALAAPVHAAVVKRMFVTSTTGNGDLSADWSETELDGVAGANEICQARAEGAGLSPGDQQFRAWLSDATADAHCNIQGLTGQKNEASPCDGGTEIGGGPWFRTDGSLFAMSLAQLEINPVPPFVPARFDESGVERTTNHFTGTGSTGALDANSCSGFSSTSGTGRSGTSFGTNTWAVSGSTACTGELNLLCFEVGVASAARPYEGAGRLTFVTSGIGSKGKLGGLAGADATCRAKAAAAHLPAPETFFAWLSVEDTDAPCHIQGLAGTVAGNCNGGTPLSSVPYRRIDGVPLADDLADLTSNTALFSTHSIDETGDWVNGSSWTGTSDLGVSTGLDCSGWMDDSAGTGTSGEQYSITSFSDGIGSVACNVARPFYCFSTAVVLHFDGFEDPSLAKWSQVQQ